MNTVRHFFATKLSITVLRLATILAASTILTVTALTQSGAQNVATVATERVDGQPLGGKAAPPVNVAPPTGKEGATFPQAGATLVNPNLITAVAYPFTSASSVALEDMSSGTTQLVATGQDDTASPVTNIGFDFWFDGVRATQFSVNANGLLRLGATQVSTGFTNGLATTTDAPKIGAYWDDLCTGANGKAHYKIVGSAPNRKLVVEWQNMQITRGAGCSIPGESASGCIAARSTTTPTWRAPASPSARQPERCAISTKRRHCSAGSWPSGRRATARSR